MLIYCPDPDVDKCVDILHPFDAAVTCSGIAQVAAIDNELHHLSPQINKHPTRRVWAGYEAPMIDYGLRLWEKIKDHPIVKNEDVKDLGQLLSDSLEFATSGTFEMTMPPWWGNGIIHLTHLSWLVTAHPGWYQPYLDTDLKLGMPLVIELPNGA